MPLIILDLLPPTALSLVLFMKEIPICTSDSVRDSHHRMSSEFTLGAANNENVVEVDEDLISLNGNMQSPVSVFYVSIGKLF